MDEFFEPLILPAPKSLRDTLYIIRRDLLTKSQPAVGTARAAAYVSDATLRQMRAGSPAVSGAMFGRILRAGDLQTRLVARLVHERLMPLLTQHVLETTGIACQLEQRNTLLYDGDAGMGWHTNHDCPGMRLYLVYNTVEGSTFRFAHGDREPLDVAEPAGWHLKAFWITYEPPYFWHAVKSAGQRLSIGFRPETGEPTQPSDWLGLQAA